MVVENGDEDLEGIAKAISTAKLILDKPSLIKIRTTIGFGSQNQGEEKVHGSPLGENDIVQLKTKFGFNPQEKFVVSDSVYQVYQEIASKGALAEKVISYSFM